MRETQSVGLIVSGCRAAARSSHVKPLRVLLDHLPDQEWRCVFPATHRPTQFQEFLLGEIRNKLRNAYRNSHNWCSIARHIFRLNFQLWAHRAWALDIVFASSFPGFLELPGWGRRGYDPYRVSERKPAKQPVEFFEAAVWGGICFCWWFPLRSSFPPKLWDSPVPSPSTSNDSGPGLKLNQEPGTIWEFFFPGLPHIFHITTRRKYHSGSQHTGKLLAAGSHGLRVWKVQASPNWPVV